MTHRCGSMRPEGRPSKGRTCRKCGVFQPRDQYPETAARGSWVCVSCVPVEDRDGDAAEFARERAALEAQRVKDEAVLAAAVEALRRNREDVWAMPLGPRRPVQLSLGLTCPEESVLTRVRSHPCEPTRSYQEALGLDQRRTLDMLDRLERDELVTRYVDLDPGHGPRLHWEPVCEPDAVYVA